VAAEPGPTQNETALAEAIQRVTASTQALVRDEIELAKLEVQGKIKTLGRGAAVGVAAGVFLAGAGLLILHGFAWLFWYLLFPDEQFFWGFFMEAGLLIIMAALAGGFAARAFKKAQPPVPDRAIAELRATQDTVSRETTLLKDQVREVVTKPEDQRQ
jgi:hypothetical protein